MFKLKVVLAVVALSTGLAACQGSTVGPPGSNSAASGAAATPTPRAAPPALEKPTYTVERGVVADELKMSGRVAATLDQDLFFTQDGFLKTLHVKRSDVVTDGQLLAELDLGTLPNDLRQAEIELSSVELAVQSRQERQQFAIQRAQLDLEDARSRLAALKQPPLQSEINAANLSIEQAKIALEDTRHSTSVAKTQADLRVETAANTVRDRQAEYARIVELNGTQSKEHLSPDQVNAEEAARRAVENAQTDLEAARIAAEQARKDEVAAIASAENALKQAELRLTALMEGPTKLEIADAERAIRRAEVALEEARTANIDPDEQNKLESAQLRVDTIRARIEAGRIYAPFDGEIADISIRPGDGVSAYRAIMNVINPTNIELVVENTLSSDMAKVGVGQQVSISFARYATTTLVGTVEKLPTSLTSTSSSVEADPAIHISFDPGVLDLNVGDIASLVLTIERKENVLWLPPVAVRSFDGRRFVVVQDADRQRRVDIKVGIVSQDRIEILEGLEEGEIVIGQ